jgi:uncharacterized membrane protein
VLWGGRSTAQKEHELTPSGALLELTPSGALLVASRGDTTPSTPISVLSCGTSRLTGCWTGETESTVEISDVPAASLYYGYGDLSRMTEWSPLLDSVTVDPQCPTQSVWVMRVPGPLRVAAKMLGYATVVQWSADLRAPGPPCMNWTSVLDDSGKLKGIPNAEFVPSGSVELAEVWPGRVAMTLRLRYELPEPTARWKIALVQSAPVQFILQSRMHAGLERFAKAMTREWLERGEAERETRLTEAR